MTDRTTIYLENIAIAPHLISVTYRYETYRFEVGIWYDVDLEALEHRYSKEFMDWLYFHIAAFEINKLSTLKPDYIDFGKYAHFVTEDFWRVWQIIQHKALAEWRFRNDLPQYKLELANPIAQPHVVTREIIKGDIEILSFFGGGKDSLVMARLLEKSGLLYSAFTYSHSIYGKAEKQHEIMGKLLETLSPQKVHRQYIYDSFIDSPILKIEKRLNLKTLIASETASSIFECLPILLSEGYQYIALGHEHSANVGNVIWDKTGEDVNHQWGKSYEAEQLLNGYVQRNLLSNFSYFSVLQPVNDVLIFQLLGMDLDKVPFTHSCNIEKPWCKKCPKCAYVWLSYMAYLPTDLVNAMFGDVNLLDLPQNQLSFQQMLGYGARTPFECIGQIEECRLALHICYLKGLRGKAMKWHEKMEREDFGAIVERYTRVHEDNGIPQKFAALLNPQFTAARKKGIAFFKEYLATKQEENAAAAYSA